ncbi:MAG: LysM peptidoglycan-binding domain-containing protein [Chloroflexota bacterium]
MTSTLPRRGKGAQDESSGLIGSSQPKKRSRSQSAMNDAQQSLNSLLNPQADDSQPRVISSSGATRNQTRGRVAAPGAGTAKPSRPGPGQLLEGGDSDADSSLALVPGSEWLYDDDIKSVSQNRVQMGLAVATQHVQTARDRASLLLGTTEAGSLGTLDIDEETLNTSRRAASKWASRYATHIVILLVVAALVGFGGLRSMTVQGAYPNGLQGVDAYAGTDHFDGDAPGGVDPDSSDYELTLPRTELGGTDAASNSRVVQPEAGQPADPGQAGAPAPAPVESRGKVITYTVAQGDTIQSVADKFDLLPETVMGSNGLYDARAALAAGRTLNIPPFDGMYYTPAEGDTVDSIARRFQVDPAVIIEYTPNNITGGAVTVGQAIIVPGGMMPQREVVISYTVKPGDTLKGIAGRYGVDVPTMLESNEIPDPDNLAIGSQLRVLPVAGMEYKIEKGDTVLSIAEKLGVTPQMILDYSPNKLTPESVLQIDQVILVPGGSPQRAPVEVAARIEPVARGAEAPVVPPKADSKVNSVKPPPKATPKPNPKPQPTAKPAAKPDNTYKAGTGRMVWPVNGTITQYFSGAHNGLDIAIRAGTPIHAADSGKVIWSGWRTDGLGYCVFIDHQNGLTTVYGHMIRQPAVYVGQYVNKGQVIGYIGSTGHSTGPHVHFMVKVGTGRSYRNPLSYLGGR